MNDSNLNVGIYQPQNLNINDSMYEDRELNSISYFYNDEYSPQESEQYTYDCQQRNENYEQPNNLSEQLFQIEICQQIENSQKINSFNEESEIVWDLYDQISLNDYSKKCKKYSQKNKQLSYRRKNNKNATTRYFVCQDN